MTKPVTSIAGRCDEEASCASTIRVTKGCPSFGMLGLGTPGARSDSTARGPRHTVETFSPPRRLATLNSMGPIANAKERSWAALFNTLAPRMAEGPVRAADRYSRRTLPYSHPRTCWAPRPASRAAVGDVMKTRICDRLGMTDMLWLRRTSVAAGQAIEAPADARRARRRVQGRDASGFRRRRRGMISRPTIPQVRPQMLVVAR